ncbi:MAG: endonuclease III [Chitinophagaceae bacterium]|nr:endonuclease III [Oligoflexus sp.]
MVALGSLVKRKAAARIILQKLEAANPNPHCELIYHTPYQLLVSVVLSAQTTDIMVNRVMAPQYEGKFTPKTTVELGIEGILARIRSIGLAPTKAKNVYNLSRILLQRFHGEVPSSREDLESLPGVGRKTANVILGEIFREPTLAVDTHVYRVTRRLGLQNESTPDKAELELLKVVDPSFLPDGHHHFILHGRYTCKALSPLCNACVLNDICPSYEDLRPKPKDGKVKARTSVAKPKTKPKPKKIASRPLKVSEMKAPPKKKTTKKV